MHGRGSMASTLLFLFGCLLCLIFLGMLYGERLSLTGLIDGEWFNPVGNLFERAWNGLCEVVDGTIEFVLSHLSWVVATASGAAGLVLILFIMGGGLARDAEAFHRDTQKPLQAGGVLDQITAMRSHADSSAVMATNLEWDLSNPGSGVNPRWAVMTKNLDVSLKPVNSYLVFGRPEYSPQWPKPRRPIEGGTIDYPVSRPVNERPMLGLTFRRLGSSVLESAFNQEVSIRGVLEESLPDPDYVDRALRQLLRDDWQEHYVGVNDSPGLPQDLYPESRPSELRDLEDQLERERIRILPGNMVSAQDLRVEKSSPAQSATGEITLQVTLTNMGRETISGLLVREILPYGTQVRTVDPLAVFRGDTLTWLLDDLRPQEEQMLRFTVLPASGELSTLPSEPDMFNLRNRDRNNGGRGDRGGRGNRFDDAGRDLQDRGNSSDPWTEQGSGSFVDGNQNSSDDGLFQEDPIPGLGGLSARTEAPRGPLTQDRLTENSRTSDPLDFNLDDTRGSRWNDRRSMDEPAGSLLRRRTSSSRDVVFESVTEVSALAAVTSPTMVSRDDVPSPLPDPFPGDRRRPPRSTTPLPQVAGAPDVRLSMNRRTVAAEVGEWTRVTFTLTNEGTAPATNVKLRLTLDPSLEHARLIGPAERQVYANVSTLPPGQSTELHLEVRPTSIGRSFSTAEVLFDGNQIGVEEFQLVTQEPVARPNTIQ